MVVERATILEWPQIEALARAYFERMGREYQDRRDANEWFVACVSERVIGCYGVQFVDHLQQMWITDLYRVDEPIGARALCRLYRHAYTRAEYYGYDAAFIIDPENVDWLSAVERYGNADLVGLLYLHKT